MRFKIGIYDLWQLTVRYHDKLTPRRIGTAVCKNVLSVEALAWSSKDSIPVDAAVSRAVTDAAVDGDSDAA